jgi:hypothetical protein
LSKSAYSLRSKFDESNDQLAKLEIVMRSRTNKIEIVTDFIINNKKD